MCSLIVNLNGETQHVPASVRAVYLGSLSYFSSGFSEKLKSGTANWSVVLVHGRSYLLYTWIGEDGSLFVSTDIDVNNPTILFCGFLDTRKLIVYSQSFLFSEQHVIGSAETKVIDALQLFSLWDAREKRRSSRFFSYLREYAVKEFVS